MKKMRLTICCILTLIIIVSMMGCSQTSGSATKGTASPSGAATSASTSSAPSAKAEEKGTIKIGLLAALSGNTAATGEQAKDAVAMYLEQNNNKIGGYKVELITEDDENTAATAVTKVKKLVEQDKVDILVGPSSTGCATAILSYITENKVPLVMTSNAGDTLTQRAKSPYAVRTGSTSSFAMFGLGEYAAKVKGFKKCAVLTYDFAYGYEIAGGFQTSFEKNGGKVIYKAFAPSGTNDFAPYITQLPLDKIDVLFYNFSGGDATRIQKQLAEFGIIGKVPVIAGYTSVDETILQDFGKAAVGFLSAHTSCVALDNPAMKKLASDFKTKYNRDCSVTVDQYWTTMLVLNSAFSNLDSKTVKDPAAIIAAIKAVKLDNVPRGSISFDDYGQAIQNVYIREIKEVDGKLVNYPIYTLEKQDQFGGANPLDYLTKPEFSKEYPKVSKAE